MTAETAEEPQAERFVRQTILQGITKRASDIIFQAKENSLLVRYRVDGVFHDITASPSVTNDQIISTIKILSGMDISVRKIPQEGRMSIPHDGTKVDIRVHVFPVLNGTNIIMRINSSQADLPLEQLGFSEQNLERLRSALRKPNGMVLVTGPAGSGKTTTLYSALKEIANPGVETLAVEHYVEQEIPHVQQIQLDTKNGCTYPETIKQFMRVGSDNIFIDELRDLDTISTAMQASMIGHLVLSSLHMDSSSKVPERLIDLGVTPNTVSYSLSAVVAQRLIRRLCDTCKETYYPKPDTLIAAKFAINGKKWAEDDLAPQLYKPSENGCAECLGTGFKGHVAISEVLLVDKAIRHLISAKAESFVIEEKAIENGMTKLIDDGWAKVLAGVTTLEDISRYIG